MILLYWTICIVFALANIYLEQMHDVAVWVAASFVILAVKDVKGAASKDR